MSRANAIKKKCLEWCAYSQKEVTLCHIVHCPLWPYRFGYSIKDKRYKQRMEAAKKKYPKEHQELQEELSKREYKLLNSAENEQIDDVLEKKTEKEYDAIPSEVSP